MTSQEHWMRCALALAEKAGQQEEVPVGAVVVLDGECIGEGFNQPISRSDPTAHAEVVALRAACATLNNYRLPGSELYVTLEPCVMCLGAIIHARISKVIYAATDPKIGVFSQEVYQHQRASFNHPLDWQSGVCATDSETLLKTFFARRR